MPKLLEHLCAAQCAPGPKVFRSLQDSISHMISVRDMIHSLAEADTARAEAADVGGQEEEQPWQQRQQQQQHRRKAGSGVQPPDQDHRPAHYRSASASRKPLTHVGLTQEPAATARWTATRPPLSSHRAAADHPTHQQPAMLQPDDSESSLSANIFGSGGGRVPPASANAVPPSGAAATPWGQLAVVRRLLSAIGDDFYDCHCLITEVIDFEQAEEGMMIRCGVCGELDDMKDSYAALPDFLTQVGADALGLSLGFRLQGLG